MAKCSNCRNYFHYIGLAGRRFCPFCEIDTDITIVPDEEEENDNGDVIRY